MQQSEFYWTFHLYVFMGKTHPSEIFVYRYLRPFLEYMSNDLF